MAGGIGGFLQGLGQQAGYNINYQQQYADTQANIDLKQQQVALGKLDVVEKQQQVESRKSSLDLFKGAMSEAKGPKEQAAALQKVMMQAMSMNDISTMNSAGAMLKVVQGEEDRTTNEALVAAEARHEATSMTASEYIATKSPEAAQALIQDYKAAGGDVTKLPPPGEKFDAWAETQQLQGKEGMNRAKFAQELQRKKSDEVDKKERLAREDAAKAEDRKATHALQQGNLDARLANTQLIGAMRSDAVAAKANKVSFDQTEKLNTKLQAAAKPILEDRQRLDDVMGLLAAGNAASDQLARQALPGLLGHFKGRATNLYYHDDKNFGDIEERASSALSWTFSGKMSDANRDILKKSLEDMRDKVVDPQLQKLEDDQREHAKKYGLDPENIEVQGQFNRKAAKTKTIGGITYVSKGDGQWSVQ